MQSCNDSESTKFLDYYLLSIFHDLGSPLSYPTLTFDLMSSRNMYLYNTYIYTYILLNGGELISSSAGKRAIICSHLAALCRWQRKHLETTCLASLRSPTIQYWLLQ